MIRSFLLAATASLSLLACSAAENAAEKGAEAGQTVTEAAANTSSTVQDTVENTVSNASLAKLNTEKLSAILAAQPESAKTRYDARNPGATLEFFGIEPGMTVIEILPGSGWYTKIISPYIGAEGHVIGADYNIDMWSEFGGFATPKFIEDRKNWAQNWVKDMTEGTSDDRSQLSAYTLGTLSAGTKGEVDMVLMIRIFHHLARFNDKGAYMDSALAELHGQLKPGGIVGIVQHEGPEENSDEWADGNNGYLKKSFVIAQMEKAGFELVGTSNVNENPRDTPTSDDNVWRLPPTLGTSREDIDLRAKMETIGESNRMTLKFIKPE